MSPDETYSKKLDKVFELTSRAFVWPIKEWDKDLSQEGRVMEMLSEHSLQGLVQGYILTGRHAVLLRMKHLFKLFLVWLINMLSF